MSQRSGERGPQPWERIRGGSGTGGLPYWLGCGVHKAKCDSKEASKMGRQMRDGVGVGLEGSHAIAVNTALVTDGGNRAQPASGKRQKNKKPRGKVKAHATGSRETSELGTQNSPDDFPGSCSCFSLPDRPESLA